MLDRRNPHRATVDLLAGRKPSGEPVFEEVPVEALDERRYRLLASPGLLDGLASGDVFERADDGSYAVVTRSGNLCVQVWYPHQDLHARVDAELLPEVNALGGWLDGRSPGISAFTVPVHATFARIKEIFDAWVAKLPGSGWSFANVYAADGETPLGWWEQTDFPDRSAAPPPGKGSDATR